MNANQVGETLKAAREGLALSKRKAAERAGISESRWRQIEAGIQYKNGVAEPAATSAETLVKMARAVQTDPVPLLEAVGFPPTAVDLVAPASEPPIVDNVLYLDRLPEREAELVWAFYQGLEAARKIRHTS